MKATILHGSNDLYGASRLLAEDVAILRELGVEVTVLLPSDGPLTGALEQHGAVVRVDRLPVLRRTTIRKMAPPPRRPHPVAAEADVVVLWTLALANHLPALRLWRKRAIVAVHEILPDRLGRMLGRLCARGREPILANSRATRDWLAQAGAGSGRIEVAYPPAPPLERRLPVPTDAGFRVLVAGRVNGFKGHVEAVNAVGALRARGLDASITLLGSPFPGQEGHLAALEDHVADKPWARYAGEVPDTRRHIGDHHVLLIATTRPESFGMVALEAWSVGRRVVAPREGGAAEAAALVDGLTFRPRDEAAMADALHAVATTPRLLEPPRADAPALARCARPGRVAAWTRLLAAT